MIISFTIATSRNTSLSILFGDPLDYIVFYRVLAFEFEKNIDVAIDNLTFWYIVLQPQFSATLVLLLFFSTFFN